MTWIKVETTIRSHPKFLRIGPEACWLYVCGVMYCQDNLTDGFIPREQVGLLYPFPRTSRLVRVLLWAQLWQQTEQPSPGYLIHDYLQWNMSREQVLKQRQQDAARKKKGRRPDVQGGLRPDSGPDSG